MTEVDEIRIEKSKRRMRMNENKIIEVDIETLYRVTPEGWEKL